MENTEAHIKELITDLQLVQKQLNERVIGQEAVIEQVLIAFLAGGHVLLEGVPGLGKTKLVRELANLLQADFKRIQFTPDLMPSDIIGTDIIQDDGKQRKLQFLKGPVFCNLLLADEINRTPPKTQAALLEAMEEGTINYAGKQYVLEQPFMVLATQNPLEQKGTYPLPEAQMDRFLLKIKLDYPDEQSELRVLTETTNVFKQKNVEQLGVEKTKRARELIREVFIDTELVKRVNNLVRSTRPIKSDENQSIRVGAGTRAGQAIILCAKARAFLQGRFSVVPSDLVAVAIPSLRHRIILSYHSISKQLSPEQVLQPLIQQLK